MDPKVYFEPEIIPEVRTAAIRDFRKAATAFARMVIDLVPPCDDRRHIMRELRSIVYLGNSAIALGGDP